MSRPKDVQYEVLKSMALLLADVAESLAPLVERAQEKPSVFGSAIDHPTPKETGASLRTKASALRLAFPEDQPTPVRTDFQTEVK